MNPKQLKRIAFLGVVSTLYRRVPKNIEALSQVSRAHFRPSDPPSPDQRSSRRQLRPGEGRLQPWYGCRSTSLRFRKSTTRTAPAAKPPTWAQKATPPPSAPIDKNPLMSCTTSQ